MFVTKTNLLSNIVFLMIVCFANQLTAQNVEVKEALVSQSVLLDKAVDMHLTASTDPLKNSTVNLASEQAWLFFDNLRPAEVLKKYGSIIKVNTKPLNVGTGGNARIAIYKQGAVVIPHPANFQPLETYTKTAFQGASVKYNLYNYYTNKEAKEVPAVMVAKLSQDNSIQSFKLKRGYMATLATDPSGLGYSRVFIADKADIVLSQLPAELNNKVSFIRVFPWQWPSKKGWCGVRGNTNVESNGVNKQVNETDLTQSTWVYSWGLSDPVESNVEFVPMKWGFGGSLENLNAKKGVTHLLGYNEPNRPDQSNMSVIQALSEWPELMKSGLRLGSPSVSDNSKLQDWLYTFMDEAKKRNYRVDFVNVHAYWGPDQAKSPEEWYKILREIHLRTGLPIWLTEWNIGANWTKEPWPEKKEDQELKQLKNLEGVLKVLDTTSFIERYSIYNWVEDKRAMIIDNFSYKTVDGKNVQDKLLSQVITPAGKFYRDNHPDFAFNPKNEVVSNWVINEVPKLNYSLTERNEFMLQWDTNIDKEMIGSYLVERSTDNKNFAQIASISPEEKNIYFEAIEKIAALPSKSVYYRVQLVDYKGEKAGVSNTVSYHYLPNNADKLSAGNITTPAYWSMFSFEQPYASEPIMVLGIPTNVNKVPQTHRVKDLGTTSFDFKFSTWDYLKNPGFAINDTIGYVILSKAGALNVKGISALVGKVKEVSSEWKEVIFDTPFKEVPVVFASQITNLSTSATSIRFRNITTKGFEVKLQYEAAVAIPNVEEEIDFIAVTPGKGTIDGKNVVVGRTAEATVGDYFDYGKIEWGVNIKSPVFFAAMQTESDGITAALRIKEKGDEFIQVFKEKEKSRSSAALTKETVGWMVMEAYK